MADFDYPAALPNISILGEYEATSPPVEDDRMLEVMQWVQMLELDERHLVWLRAKRFDWVEIGKRMACDRTTAWRRWKRDLQVLADRMNDLQSGPDSESL